MEEARPSGEDIGSTKAQKRLLYPVDGSGGEVGASWLENVSTGELLPHPHHLWQVGELGMPLTSCGTPEIWPCASPGQYTTADPVSRDAGVPAQGYECERDGPTTALPCNSMGEREASPLPLAPRHLQQVGELAPGVTRVGEQTLCLAWAAQ